MTAIPRNQERWNNVISTVVSSLLLALAYTNSALWYFSLFAFVPFLWRLCHVNLRGAVALGVVMATSFVLISSLYESPYISGKLFFRLFSFNAAFVVFASGVNRAKRSFGFDPLLIALLWFPIEFVLISFAEVGDIFSISKGGSKIVVGFCTLFGFVFGSLVVVLVNSLIIILLKHAEEIIGRDDIFVCRKRKGEFYRYNANKPERNRSTVSEARAPPRVFNKNSHS
jgi:apolipoprotein N-acyltransferase